MGAGASSPAANTKKPVALVEGMKEAIKAARSAHQTFKAPDLDDSVFMLNVVPSDFDCGIMYTVTNGRTNFVALRSQQQVIADKNLLFQKVEDSEANEKQRWATYINNLYAAVKNKTFFIKVPAPNATQIQLYVRIQEPASHNLVTTTIPLEQVQLNVQTMFDLKLKMFATADANLKERERAAEKQKLDAAGSELKLKELQSKLEAAEAAKVEAQTKLEHLQCEFAEYKSKHHGVSHHNGHNENHGTEPISSIQLPKSSIALARKESIRKATLSPKTYELPAQRVVAILNHWKEKYLQDQNEIRSFEYIVSVIENDELYSADVDTIVNKEADTEIREWLQNEMQPASAVRRWNKLKAFARALKFTSILKPIPFNVNDHIPAPVLALMHNVDELDWDVFEVMKVSEGRGLYYTALYLFHKHNLIDKFGISVQKLLDFFDAVEKGYKNNPYHCAIHGCDVMQTVHHFLTKGGFGHNLSQVDIMAAIVAAAAHDIGHPGVSNLFERLTESERALLYNDQSILENFHCAQTFKLLQDPLLNITENMTKDDKRQFRDMVINMILATDIGRHFAILDTVRRGILKKFDPNDKEDLNNYMKLIVKCADVGNPAKRLETSELWSHRVQEEFFAQGDEEKRLGLPVSPFMDREKPNLPKSQIGFIDYIAKPLYECLVQFDPKLQVCMSNMINTKKHWEAKAIEQAQV